MQLKIYLMIVGLLLTTFVFANDVEVVGNIMLMRGV